MNTAYLRIEKSSYIEAVALTWAKEGIDTEEKAREATVSYNGILIMLIKPLT